MSQKSDIAEGASMTETEALRGTEEEMTILIVDDQIVNRAVLREIFREEYKILEAANGEEAIQLITEYGKKINAVLLDIIMPVKNGFDVLKWIKEEGLLPFVPVIMITGDSYPEVEQRGFLEGVSEFLAKPFEPTIVYKRVHNVIDLYTHKNHLEKLVKKQTAKIHAQSNKLREMNNQLIECLSTAVEFRSMESGNHVRRIRGLTKILAECVKNDYPEYWLDDENIEKIASASVLHDVGKIAIEDSILLKPGRLTKEEFEIMKSHTTKGCEIVNTLDFIDDKEFFRYCYDICRHHHEKYDGKGYPDGLEGDNIPICAQIVSIADVYDALVSDRVYKAGFPKDKAYDMIMNGECGLFNPKLLGCFTKVREKFEAELS